MDLPTVEWFYQLMGEDIGYQQEWLKRVGFILIIKYFVMEMELCWGSPTNLLGIQKRVRIANQWSDMATGQLEGSEIDYKGFNIA